MTTNLTYFRLPRYLDQHELGFPVDITVQVGSREGDSYTRQWLALPRPEFSLYRWWRHRSHHRHSCSSAECIPGFDLKGSMLDAETVMARHSTLDRLHGLPALQRIKTLQVQVRWPDPKDKRRRRIRTRQFRFGGRYTSQRYVLRKLLLWLHNWYRRRLRPLRCTHVIVSTDPFVCRKSV